METLIVHIDSHAARTFGKVQLVECQCMSAAFWPRNAWWVTLGTLRILLFSSFGIGRNAGISVNEKDRSRMM